MGKAIQLTIGVIISVAMMYLAFRDVDFAQLGQTLQSVEWWPIIPFVALWLFHYVARAIRWRFLLPAPIGKQVPIRSLFDSIILGNLATFLLPFRLGEFIRPLILSRWSDYTFASGFASVVIERFFDLSAVLLSFAIIVPMLPELPSWANVGAYSLGVLAICLLIFIVSACLIPGVVRKVVEIFFRPFPSGLRNFAIKFSNDLLDGASVVRSIKRLSIVILMTVIVWVSAYAQFYVVFYMFPHSFSVLLATTTGVFVALAVALPTMPGFVGVFQIACVAACSLFGYPRGSAQAYSLLIHVMIFVLCIVTGFSLLAFHGMSLSELKSAAKKPQRATS